MKKHFIHPLVYAILPTLVLYKQNIQQAWPNLTFKPLSLSLLLAFVSWVVFYLLLKSKNKASIMTSSWLILFFTYGHTFLFLANKGVFNFVPIGPHLFLLSIYFLILIIVFTWLFLSKKSLIVATSFLNVASVVLLFMNLSFIIPFEVKRLFALNKVHNYMENQQLSKQEYSNKDSSTYPDIYYFIFDRYPNQDVLEEYYGVDNSEFLNSLEDEDYFVASKSAANFPASFQSISSSLNMSDITFIPKLLGDDYSDRAVVYKELLLDNEVTKFLLDKGYDYYHLGSSWEASKYNKLATKNYNQFIGFSEFQSFLYENTILNVLVGKINGKQTFTSMDLLNIHQKNVPYKVEKIKELISKDSPKFVFSHFLLPHPPYLFGSGCEQMDLGEVRVRELNDAYLDQIECANIVMKDISKTIKENSHRPVVIIFQSDEGPIISKEHEDEYAMFNVSPEESHRIHAKILNAYYLSDRDGLDQSANYDDIGITTVITPVNSFRFIFNYYFGSDFKILENRTFVFDNENVPYKFKEITGNIWK